MVYIYPGALHIHTAYSDGTGSIKEIAKAAKKAGLKWIIISDHNTLKGLYNGEEGWYEGVAVIIGSEISPDDSDHYLAFGIKDEIDCNLHPKEYIKRVKEQGGIGFIAHPDESANRENSYKPLRWNNWDIDIKETGVTGIEIWNHLSDWVDNYNPKRMFYNYFFRNHSISGPTEKTLKWWDKLNNIYDEIVPAIGGVDVHALDYKLGPLTFKVFPYEDSFKTITNFLYIDDKLPEDFNEAKSIIFKSLKEGRSSIINRAWDKSFNQPIFYIQDKGKRVFPGGQIELTPYSTLFVKLPKVAQVRVIYDGQLIWDYEGKALEFNSLDLGKYRIEVYYKNKPWVFTNPIKINES